MEARQAVGRTFRPSFRRPPGPRYKQSIMPPSSPFPPDDPSSDETEWEIPTNLRPDPSDYDFDLERTLRSVVGLRASAPANAYTAASLGTDRVGSGVVIAGGDLVLTVGYLITETEQIWLVTADGRAVAGHALGVDPTTGLGLVLPLGRLDMPPLEFGKPEALQLGDPAVLAAGGGRDHAVETKLAGRQEFAGYWEYLLDEALFTAPAHPYWSGTALLDSAGKLLGIGSLILQQGDGKRRMDMNMVVPISLLAPVLDDLTTIGRPRGRPRPWLGVYAMESDGGIVIGGLSPRSPAETAGLRQGDHILAIGGEDVIDLASLWRKLWASGPVGTEVRLRIGRDGEVETIRLASSDRALFLQGPRLH